MAKASYVKEVYDIGSKTWRQSEDEFLLENYNKMTAEEIGKELGRTKGAITNRLYKLELTKRTPLTFYHDRIVKLAQQGKQYSEIAKVLDVSTSAVRKYMKEKEVEIKPKAPNLSEIAVKNGLENPIELDEENVTFKDWFIYWYQTYRKDSLREVTRKKYYADFGNLCAQPIIDKRIEDITRGDTQNYLNWYGKERSKVTVSSHWQKLKTCMKDAMMDGYIKKNPFENINPVFKEQNYSVAELKAKRDTKKWLEKEEYTKLKYHLLFWLERALTEEPMMNYIGRYKANGKQIIHQTAKMAIFIMLKTGARFSEVMGITREDILFETSEINIDKTWNYKSQDEATFDQTKTIASIRKIYMDKETMTILNRYIEWLDRFGVETKENTLFVLKDVNTYNDTYNNMLKSILKELDIEQITVHKLRHTHASILLADNVPIQLVAKRLGHTDTNMIRKVYGHLLKETEEDGNRMIANLL